MKLVKKYSRTYIMIEPDLKMDKAGSFVGINYYSKQDNKLVESEIILDTEVGHVIEILKRNGYE